MKKLFAILAVCLFIGTVQSNAQGVVTKGMTTSLSSSVDSIRCISTTPNYLYINPTNAYKCGIFQSTVTRVSVAIGGSIFLQGSVDGTNWFTATYAAGDTNTVADAASQVLKIEVKPTNGLPYRYYRIKCTGANADTMTVKAKFNGRQ